MNCRGQCSERPGWVAQGPGKKIAALFRGGGSRYYEEEITLKNTQDTLRCAYVNK